MRSKWRPSKALQDRVAKSGEEFQTKLNNGVIAIAGSNKQYTDIIKEAVTLYGRSVYSLDRIKDIHTRLNKDNEKVCDVENLEYYTNEKNETYNLYLSTKSKALKLNSNAESHIREVYKLYCNNGIIF